MSGSLDNLTAVVVALRGYKPDKSVASSVAEPYKLLSSRIVGWDSETSSSAAANGLFSARVHEAVNQWFWLWGAQWLNMDAVQ